jgi:hypothetical protein
MHVVYLDRQHSRGPPRGLLFVTTVHLPRHNDESQSKRPRSLGRNSNWKVSCRVKRSPIGVFQRWPKSLSGRAHGSEGLGHFDLNPSRSYNGLSHGNYTAVIVVVYLP